MSEARSFIAEDEHQSPVRTTIYAKYQSWYTRARRVVVQLIPERVNTFDACYDRHRKDNVRLTVTNYSISDYISGIVDAARSIDTDNRFMDNLGIQIGILGAAYDMTDSAVRSIELTILHDIAKSNIAGADELILSGHLRAAGVVCGTVLEKHLRDVCASHEIKLSKKPTLADLNESLKKAGIYDIPLWRLVQRLADIRNICAHATEREPTADEVRDLMRETEKILAEIS